MASNGRIFPLSAVFEYESAITPITVSNLEQAMRKIQQEFSEQDAKIIHQYLETAKKRMKQGQEQVRHAFRKIEAIIQQINEKWPEISTELAKQRKMNHAEEKLNMLFKIIQQKM